MMHDTFQTPSSAEQTVTAGRRREPLRENSPPAGRRDLQQEPARRVLILTARPCDGRSSQRSLIGAVDFRRRRAAERTIGTPGRTVCQNDQSAPASASTLSITSPHGASDRSRLMIDVPQRYTAQNPPQLHQH